MATVQDLYESAIASSTANDAGKLSTDTEILNHLNRTFQLRFAVWSQIVGGAASGTPLLLTFSGTPATVTLPTDIIDVDRLEVGGLKVRMFPVEEKDRSWHLPPGVYRQGLTLVSRGNAGDPIIGNILTAWIDDAPATLTALSSVIDVRFPVRFHKLLILDLALYLDTKDEGRDPAGHQKLLDEFNREEQMFGAVIGVTDTTKREMLTRQSII